MLKYIIRRLLFLPVVLFVVTLVLFVLFLQVPAEQRVNVYLPSVRSNMSEADYERLVQRTIERYGLDRPLSVQYVEWVKSFLQGDWGYSPSWREPVLDGLLRRAPATLELTLFAMVPATALAIGLGRLAARRRGAIPDHLIRSAAFLGWAFPPFILALILINVAYARTGWFPPERMSIWAGPIVRGEGFRLYTGLLTVDSLLNGEPRIFWDAIRHLVLPATCLALAQWALLARVMRASLLDVASQDYITTARAKGLSEAQVVNRHAVRNALLPVISTAGVTPPLLITAVAVIEVVFNFNGVGRWAVQGFLSSEIPVTVGFALFSCIITVLASLSADILYAAVDPRVRLY
jgi:ABC-type dipeptide/oligopeptide/nickel transport system permease component